LKAAEQLCIQSGYKVVGSLVIIELIDRKGRDQLQNPDQLSALVQLANADLATIDVESNDRNATS
jgi:adenine/guanine phosphoribosyltransferase-like PRPP-binding protein